MASKGPSSSSCAAAVRERRITSRAEASLRQRLGAAAAAAAVAAHLWLRPPHALTCVLLAAAAGVWRTGTTAL